MKNLDHGRAIIAEGLIYLETNDLIVCMAVLRNVIIETHFDAAVFFVGIKIIGQVD